MQGFIDTASWDETLALFAKSDIYFSLDYHKLAADGVPSCFLYQERESSFCLPIIETPIGDTGLRDFSTCYGYSGPLSTTDEPGFLARSWASFHQCCRERGLVAGFIRFHPLLENQRFADHSGVEARLNRKTVFIDLTRPEAQLWNSKIDSTHYWIRRAKREGATFIADTEWRNYDAFIALYRSTMERHQAAAEYRFSDKYFADLRRTLGDRGFLACVMLNDRLIAAAVILTHAPFAHYHLGGSDEAFRPLCPNALLFVEAAYYLRSVGYGLFHLGGGSDARDDNSLLYFKQRLSQDVASFYTASVIVDQERYQALCKEWEQSAPPAAQERYRSYTLKYRYTL